MDFVAFSGFGTGLIAFIYFIVLSFFYNDIIKRDMETNEKIFWALVLYFLPFAGIVLYLMHRKK